jgi:hypothetical protein
MMRRGEEALKEKGGDWRLRIEDLELGIGDWGFFGKSWMFIIGGESDRHPHPKAVHRRRGSPDIQWFDGRRWQTSTFRS